MTSCDVQAVAAALTGSPDAKVGAAKGGGNNRLYQVWDGQGHAFALKSYPPHTPNQHNRLLAEFRALAFMTDMNVTVTPQAFAADEAQNFALYEWVDGQVVSEPSSADLDQVLACFLAAIWNFRRVAHIRYCSSQSGCTACGHLA